jgi:hypothetical protein
MHRPLSSARPISISVCGALAWAGFSDHAALSLRFPPCSRRNSKNVKRAAVLCPSLVCSRWLVLAAPYVNEFPYKNQMPPATPTAFWPRRQGFSFFLGALSTSLASRIQRALNFKKPTFLSRGGLRTSLISPTHKWTEGRAPVWGSEFTTKVDPKGGFFRFSF